jgi:hypothetical protein
LPCMWRCLRLQGLPHKLLPVDSIIGSYRHDHIVRASVRGAIASVLRRLIRLVRGSAADHGWRHGRVTDWRLHGRVTIRNAVDIGDTKGISLLS